ncbi:Uncharacterized protein P5673_012298 [Acropora cervicornis]|uniref:Integrase zinc-binding domain-containing protein n=1 Tax=Acropora cervicornis TaxID=6130 RepID=A0AAD9V7P1_ACRCE|nr:Uncharacterized protein P5673_012298 [Acropora cervicornis]
MSTGRLDKFWNFRDEIAVHEGILIKHSRAVIPKACQPEILCLIHTGHQGIEKGRLCTRQAVYWCGIDKDIEDMLKKCAACQHHQVSNPTETIIQQEALRPWEVLKLSSTRSQDVNPKLKGIFSEFGIPSKVISHTTAHNTQLKTSRTSA